MSDKKLAKTGSTNAEYEYEGGLAVIAPDAVKDPGLEPHRTRMTDKSVKHEKAAARQVAAMFFASVVGSAFAIYAYFAFPLTCLLYTSPSPRDRQKSRMPSSA